MSFRFQIVPSLKWWALTMYCWVSERINKYCSLTSKKLLHTHIYTLEYFLLSWMICFISSGLSASWTVMNSSSFKEKPQISYLFFLKKIINSHFFLPFTFFSVWEWFEVVIGMSISQPFIKCKPENLWKSDCHFWKASLSVKSLFPLWQSAFYKYQIYSLNYFFLGIW